MSKETRIGNTIYKSRAEAAKAVGVSLPTLYKAINDNTLDRFGKSKTKRPKKFYVRGKPYTSYRVCAQIHNCAVDVVKDNVERGTTDLIPPPRVKRFNVEYRRECKRRSKKYRKKTPTKRKTAGV